jgi:hypothetical protein
MGRKEITRALTQGRVAHLLLDPAAAEEPERLVESALATSALVTPVQADDTAEALAGSDGVAALLRY